MIKENRWIENIFNFKKPKKPNQNDLRYMIDRFSSVKYLKASKKHEKIRSQLFSKNNYDAALSQIVSL